MSRHLFPAGTFGHDGVDLQTTVTVDALEVDELEANDEKRVLGNEEAYEVDAVVSDVQGDIETKALVAATETEVKDVES